MVDRSDIVRIIERTLNLKEQLTEDASMETVAKWDSLNQLYIIMNIEKELKVKFAIDRIPDLNSVEAIWQEIQML